MVIGIRLRQLVLAQKQCVESLAFTELKFLVHFDRFERTNLDANLAAHTDRDIDVEYRRIKLRLAHVIGLLVFALNNIDALRRAFLLADLARHAAQTGFRIVAVVREERKVAIVLGQRNALLRILHRDQTILLEITSDEVPGRDRHSLEYARADHAYFIDPLLPSRYQRCRESPLRQRQCDQDKDLPERSD